MNITEVSVYIGSLPTAVGRCLTRKGKKFLTATAQKMMDAC